MKHLNIFNQTELDLKEYEETLNVIFKNVELEKGFSVIFVNNDQIKELNNNFRKIDEVTDVLSFISDEEDYLGDVFIAIEKAVEQASTYEHSVNREIGFLAVHGYLHLMGYDHQTKEEEIKMNSLTEEILEKANIKRSK